MIVYMEYNRQVEPTSLSVDEAGSVLEEVRDLNLFIAEPGDKG